MAALWATGTNNSTIGGGVLALASGAIMLPGTWVISPSGQVRLDFQVDGNLVLTYLPSSTILWASATGPGLDAAQLIMQTDGNLVIYNSVEVVLWESNTDGDEGAYLVLQNDGNLVIYAYTVEGVQPTLGVFTIPPNWEDGSIETLSWLTSVTESPQAVEQRMGLRISPRQMFEYGFTRFNRSRSHFDLLNMVAAGSPFYLPIWHDKAVLTSLATVGVTTLNLDTQYTEFQNCTVAVLMASEYDYELVEIDSFTDSSLTLATGTQRLWPAGSLIYPCKRVRVESQASGERHADKAFKGRMRFQSLEPNDSNSAIELNEYLGNFVLEDEPNDAGGVQYSYQRKEYLLDENTGVQLLSDVAPFINQKHAWFAKGRLRAWRLRGLLYALQGKRRPIWVSSGFADFELAEPADELDTTITIYRCGYSDVGGPFAHRDHISIHMRDGTRLYRKILSSVVVGAEGLYETIELNAALGIDLALNSVLRISFITFCRLDQDSIELMHHTDSRGMTTANLTWRTDPGIGGAYSETVTEVEPPDPEVEPPPPLVITDPFRLPAGKLWMYSPAFAGGSADIIDLWWESRRPDVDVIADNPRLAANIGDAFPPANVSVNGVFITLPDTGSFLVRVRLFFDFALFPEGPPTSMTVRVIFDNSELEPLEQTRSSEFLLAGGEFFMASGRESVYHATIDHDQPLIVNIQYEGSGDGGNCFPRPNPENDPEPYHGRMGFGLAGDSAFVIEWWP